jgi:hypothetical protein
VVIWEPLKDRDGKVDVLKDAKRDEAFGQSTLASMDRFELVVLKVRLRRFGKKPAAPITQPFDCT